MKYIYTVIFDDAKEFAEEGINVVAPDIFGGVTCGDNYDDAVFMAKDLIKIMLEDAPNQCQKPTPYERMKELFPDRRLVVIEVEVEKEVEFGLDKFFYLDRYERQKNKTKYKNKK